MPRHSSRDSELYNLEDALHNLTTREEDEYRMNYLFMKHSPIYLRLEQKYKAMKKLARERELQIAILNRQFFELAERYSFERSQRNVQPPVTDFPTPIFRHVQVPPKPEHVVEVALENERIIDPEPIIVETPLVELYVEPTVLVVEEESDEVVFEEQEAVVEESESVVVDEVVEESDEVVEESEEVVEEQEEVVEEPEEVVEEQEEVVEEQEEVVEEPEEVVEEPEEVVEEEEGVYETLINGTRYYITNDTDGEIYAILDDDDIGDVVGRYVEGKPIFD